MSELQPSPSPSAFPASTALSSPRTAQAARSQGKELHTAPRVSQEGWELPTQLSTASSSVTEVLLSQRKAPGELTASALCTVSSTDIQSLLGFHCLVSSQPKGAALI